MGVNEGRQHRKGAPIHRLQPLAAFGGRKDGIDAAAGHRQHHVPPGAGPAAVQEPAAVKCRRTPWRRFRPSTIH